MRKKAFFRNLPTIASLGILGTYIAFAVIAFTLYGFSRVINITLAVSPLCCTLTTEQIKETHADPICTIGRLPALTCLQKLSASDAACQSPLGAACCEALITWLSAAMDLNHHQAPGLMRRAIVRSLPVPAQDCLALGAIFATTDSVAVLQVLEPDRAPLLFNLVFGEGVINDATTVALLRTVQVRGRGWEAEQ